MVPMQVQKIIEQLGFSAKEAKVYLAALSLGECHISDIAKKVKMPRTSVQIIVDKLYKAGLMNFYVMRRYKYWVDQDPERLLYNFKKKESLMEEVLPRLSALRRSARNKKRLKDSHSFELFRMLADTINQPVLITNEEIEIVYVNELWEKQFGYVLDEVRGESPSMVTSGKTPDEVYRHMWKALNSEKMFQSDEIVDKRKDGTFFNAFTVIFPVRHEGNIFFIQILDDVTDKKQANDFRQNFLKTN